MATLGDVATKSRALVHGDTSNYTDANLLIDINLWYQKVVSMIFDSQDDSDFDDARSTNYPVQTTPMIANQRDYTMPVSERMLKLKRVDITYDGVNWYRADPLDTGKYQFGIGYNNSTSVDANFDANFIKAAPRYDYAYNSIWVMPMPVAADVTAGGKIRAEWFRNVVPFTTADYTSVLTDSTAVPGFDAPYHMILAWGAAFEFATANNLPQLPVITQQLSDWEQRIRAAYGKKDLDTRLYLSPDYSNSYN
jgi:hypothetical protein